MVDSIRVAARLTAEEPAPDTLRVFVQEPEPPFVAPGRQEEEGGLADRIVVYVRKGTDDNERRLTFTRPAGLSARELLSKGIAIDGNQAVLSVSGSYERDEGWSFTSNIISGWQPTLADALLETERALLELFEPTGLEVDFR